MQVVENIALISINATLFVQLASFLLFMMIFNRIMVGPLRKLMSEREKYMQQIVTEIADANLAYEKIGKQIISQENRARDEAFKISSEIEMAGQQQAADILDDTRSEINRIRADAQKETSARIAAVREEIHSEAEKLADRMVASLLDRRSTI
jgi:F-type H+-transporting ATPase subunit b